MKSTATHLSKLEDLPNIGKSIAADLRGLGIMNPQQLAARDPLATYLALGSPMGKRHDPCVYYTLLAAEHFLRTGEKLSWWTFTAQGKTQLAAHDGR
jgi:DNA transformation protein